MKVRGWFGAIGRRAAAVLVMGVLAAPLVSWDEAGAFPCFWVSSQSISNAACLWVSGSYYCYASAGPAHREKFCAEITSGASNCASFSEEVNTDIYSFGAACATSKCPGMPSIRWCVPAALKQDWPETADSCNAFLSGNCGIS